MLSNYKQDAWDAYVDLGNNILGAHLKCSKGHWVIDDVDAGKSMRICVIMPTAMTGQILWKDGKIAERDIGLVEEGFAPPRQLREGWSPYTSFQCVRADDGNVGELITFTSSSWGGRNAFQHLASQYRLKRRLQFPICALETKERGDIDPIFRPVGWSDRNNFSDLLPPSTTGDVMATIEHPPEPPQISDLIKPIVFTKRDRCSEVKVKMFVGPYMKSGTQVPQITMYSRSTTFLTIPYRPKSRLSRSAS